MLGGMGRDRYKVGLIQMSMTADVDDNLRKAVEMVRDAAGRGASLICLPEMYRSQYFCQEENHDNFSLAEPIPGPSTQTLGPIARELGVTVVAPIFERRAAGLYHNSLVMITPESEVSGVYRKMHIPDDPAFYEKFYFTPGDLGFKAFDTPVGKVGTLICWDQWYPEGARLTALRGADILFYPTAIGWHPAEKEEFGAAQHDAWRTIQRSHAIANGLYVAAVNRCGHEITVDGTAGIEFWGRSFIADPFGVVIAEAGREEEIVIGEVDAAKIETTRQHWPFLRDRRIDSYGDIEKRFIDV